MPPPKKAAKKAAKKLAMHHADKHHDHEKKPHKDSKKEGKDLRRAFEHMRRVAILQPTLQPSAADTVTTLATLARQQLASGNNKDAADLLRGSEHFSFAVSAGNDSDEVKGVKLSNGLVLAVREQFEELCERADEHWSEEEDRPDALTAIYQSARKSAAKAFKGGEYYQALEFVRAAEALAHVKMHGSHALEAGSGNAKAGLIVAI